MRELQLALISVVLTLGTAVLGYFFEKSVWNVVQIMLLENILLLTIQIYLKQRDEDSAIASSLAKIRPNRDLWNVVAGLFKAIADSSSHKNEFFSKQMHDFLADARRAVDNLNEGVLRIDLRPGGFFFREAEAPQNALTSFWATSYVDPSPYWRGAVGARLLARSRKKVADKVGVSRIFIEHSANMNGIADIVKANADAGVVTKTAEADALDSRLRRDFAIVDGGKLAVELILGEHREPVEARYYSPDTEAGRKAISELISVWNQLEELAR